MVECSDPILENDNIMVTPYNVTKLLDDIKSSYYTFVTEDADKYIIIFNKIPEQNSLSVSYKLSGSNNITQIVNKGRFFRVMSTICSVVHSYIESNQPDAIFFQAVENYDGDLRRYNINKRYILSLIPSGYTLEENLEKRSLILKKFN